MSHTAAAGVVSAFALMRLVSALACGRLVNAIGARVVLGTGIAIVAGSSALAGLSGNYLELLLLRGVGGIGSAMFTVSASSVLIGATTSAQRGRAMGTFSGGFLLGGIAGPLLGGVVTGISLRAPFFVYAVTLAVAGGVGLARLPRHRRVIEATTASTPSAMTIGGALRLRAFRAAAAANLADNWAALGVRSAIVPLFVIESLHERPYWTGIGFAVFTAANVVTLIVGGRLADRRGRKPMLIIGCLGSALGVSLFALPASVPVFLIGMLIFGLGSGLLDVAPGAMVGDVVGGRGGTVIAAYQMAGDIGSLSGPLLAGALADSTGYGAAFGTTAFVLVGAAAVAARAPETLVREPVPKSFVSDVTD